MTTKADTYEVSAFCFLRRNTGSALVGLTSGTGQGSHLTITARVTGFKETDTPELL